MSIATQYQELRARLGEKRTPQGEIHLVAVCKSQPIDKIRSLLQLGHRRFGENKVQEAQDHWKDLRKEFPDVELHLIGPLQSNKAKDAVSTFDVIETIDRVKIADAVSMEAQKQNKRVECYIQVNIGDEPQKSGAVVGDLESLVKHCKTCAGIALTGLMCVPPADESPAPYFALMQMLAKHYGLKNLSMGMSGDFMTAIQFGATHVRIGTALFGARDA